MVCICEPKLWKVGDLVVYSIKKDPKELVQLSHCEIGIEDWG